MFLIIPTHIHTLSEVFGKFASGYGREFTVNYRPIPSRVIPKDQTVSLAQTITTSLHENKIYTGFCSRFAKEV